MSLELLELAVRSLDQELLGEVVFVGAATLPLWITDEAAPPLRPTADVDVVVEVATQSEAVAHAATVTLPSEAVIRCAPPAYLLATKFEAFASRGRGDVRGSKDFEDIVAFLDGRAALPDELAGSPEDVQQYVAAQARGLLTRPDIVEGLEGAMSYGLASQERATIVVEPRLHALAALAHA